MTRRNSINGSFAAFLNDVALEFDGINDFLSGWVFSDFNFVHSTGIFTMSFWIALTDYTVGGVDYVAATVNTGAGRGFGLSYNSATGSYMFTVGRGGANILNISTGTVVNNNNYHHLLVTGDSVNGYIYINGVQQAFGAFSGVFSALNSNLMTIGQNSNNSAYIAATMDEIAFWTSYSDSSVVSEIYNGGTPKDLTTLSNAASLWMWLRNGDDPGDNIDGSGITSPTNQIVDQVAGAGNGRPSAGMSNANFVAFVP